MLKLYLKIKTVHYLVTPTLVGGFTIVSYKDSYSVTSTIHLINDDILLYVYRVTVVVHWSANVLVRGTWSESSAGAWDAVSPEYPASMSRCPNTWTGSDKSPTNTRKKDES